MTSKERAAIVGQRIVSARKRKGISQTALASRLAERSGLDPLNVRRSLVNNETGRNEPRLERLRQIAEETGQPLEFFTVAEVDGVYPFRGGDGDDA